MKMNTQLILTVFILFFLACNTLLPTPTEISSEETLFQERGLYELEPPGEPQFSNLVWSPNSSQLLLSYSRAYMGEFSEPSLYQMQILDINLRELSILLESGENILTPQAWLLNNEIIYYADSKGFWGIQTDAKQKHFLLESDQAVWSVDGTKIAYEVPSSGDQEEFSQFGFYDKKLDKEVTSLTLEIPNTAPFLMQWHPYKNQVLFLLKGLANEDPGMYIFETEKMDGYLIGTGGFYGNASWSPDGNYIIYSYQEALGNNHRKDLFLMKSDGSCSTKILSGNGHDINSSTWSPDGKWIAFTRNGGIYILNVQALGNSNLENILICN
ncbi:MAG: PD40 domain-containing protein [Chloroflexi bacterium]|nr:PD40 domain-containing protein [Chloroflexota bacterium]